MNMKYGKKKVSRPSDLLSIYKSKSLQVYVAENSCHLGSQRPPEATSEGINSKNALGACPQTSLAWCASYTTTLHHPINFFCLQHWQVYTYSFFNTHVLLALELLACIAPVWPNLECNAKLDYPISVQHLSTSFRGQRHIQYTYTKM